MHIIDCEISNCGYGIVSDGPIDGLHIDGLRVTNTPTLIKANGPLTNSTLRRITHQGIQLHPDAECWCGTGRSFKKCHGRWWRR